MYVHNGIDTTVGVYSGSSFWYYDVRSSTSTKNTQAWTHDLNWPSEHLNIWTAVKFFFPLAASAPTFSIVPLICRLAMRSSALQPVRDMNVPRSRRGSTSSASVASSSAKTVRATNYDVTSTKVSKVSKVSTFMSRWNCRWLFQSWPNLSFMMEAFLLCYFLPCSSDTCACLIPLTIQTNHQKIW